MAIHAGTPVQQQSDTLRSRFSLEAVAIGGPGALIGGGASFELLRIGLLRLAVEASALTNVRDDVEFAPCPLPPTPCATANKPPFITSANTAALRGEYLIGAGWQLVASAGIVSGEWRRPRGSSHTPLDLGLGIARRSRSGRQTFEIRAHRIETHSYPTYAGRVAWRLTL